MLQDTSSSLTDPDLEFLTMLRCALRNALLMIVAATLLQQQFAWAENPTSTPADKQQSIQLFDGKTLKNWAISDFGGQGDVRVEDGKIVLEPGEPITGIRWTGKKLPTVNYEISYEAQRVDGNDFFCALTFPVKDNPCTLILGGWGGSLTGLSNINDFDASENDTTDYFAFENGKWYHVKVRVDEKYITAWLDDEPIAKVDHTENRISIRIEMELSKPLGIATFQSTGAIRNLKLTKLPPNGPQQRKASPPEK